MHKDQADMIERRCLQCGATRKVGVSNLCPRCDGHGLDRRFGLRILLVVAIIIVLTIVTYGLKT